MRKLEDIMDHYECSDTTIPNEPLTEGEKSRILEKTLAKAGLAENTSFGAETVSRRKRSMRGANRSRRRTWTVAAACVLVLAMATVSFAAMALDKSFLEFFGVKDPRQEEMLGNLGTLIDKQITDNGTTIDVREAVGDGNSVNILFDITAPEGTVLDQDYYSFANAWVDIPSSPGGAGYSFEQLPDDNPADNKLTMMLSYQTEKNLDGKTMRFRFSDLMSMKSQEEIDAALALPPREEPGTPGDEYDTMKVIASGSWELEFPLNYKDNSERIKTDTDVELLDGVCTIEEVRYSPISVTMTIKGDPIKNADEEGVFGSTNSEIEVHLKDGATVPCNNSSGSSYGDTMTVSAQFAEIVDPANIASISYAGATVEINK